MKIALVDGDIVAYRCAASAENDDMSIALMRTDILMKDIMDNTQATSHKVFLSGSKDSNFRYTVNPSYKANRIGKPEPKHLAACKQFLVTHWGAVVCDGHEADDALGYSQTHETIICSIDKDLLQITGSHYNIVKKTYTQVEGDQGLKAFYTQTLVGDTSDNIIGVVGIGPVKAAKILDPLEPEEWYDACKDLYCGDVERYHNNCKLLWIWRVPNGVWQTPNLLEEEGTPFPT